MFILFPLFVFLCFWMQHEKEDKFILVNSVSKDLSNFTKVDIFLELIFHMGKTSFNNTKNFMHLIGYFKNHS